jgi:hypothetical protein
LSAAGPIRIDDVASAIRSSGAIAGWKSRSWKTVKTSTPAASARVESST